MTIIKLFFDPFFREKKQSYNLLSDLFWNKKNLDLLTEKSVIENFQVTDQIKESDAVVLPLVWNYFVKTNLINQVGLLYEKCLQERKPLIIFSIGDFTANIPFEGVNIFQNCAYRSRNGLRGQILFTIPPFISDYQHLYCDDSIQYREYNLTPTVGFCGQSNGNIIDYSRREFYLKYKRLLFKLGFEKWEPPPIEPSLYRNKILKMISENRNIKTNYLMRTKYRAGYRPQGRKDPFHPTRLEFIQNILDSDYTVCMRGGGNFSVRLYETLSLGRIPIFIDSDSPLPFEEFFNFRDYFVYIKENELENISEKILSFHQSLTPDEFLSYQQRCYALWLNYFSKKSYIENLHKLISRIVNHEK